MFLHYSSSRLTRSLISLLPLLASSSAYASSHGNEQTPISDVKQYASSFTFSVMSEPSVARLATVARFSLGISVSAASRDEAKALGKLERENLGAFLDTLPTEAVSYSLGTAYDVYEDGGSRNGKDMVSEGSDTLPSVTYCSRGDTTVTFQDQAALQSFATAYMNSTAVNVDWVNWKLASSAKAAALRDLRHQIVREARQVGADYAEAVMPDAHFRLADITESSVYENQYEDDEWRSYNGVDLAAPATLEPPKVYLHANVMYKFVMEA